MQCKKSFILCSVNKVTVWALFRSFGACYEVDTNQL